MQLLENSNYIKFEALKFIEKDDFHLTINYFWVQMVSNFIAIVDKRLKSSGASSAPGVKRFDFDEFYRQPECQKLRNSLLYEKYYSPSVIDSQSSAIEFVMPNIKNFSSVI